MTFPEVTLDWAIRWDPARLSREAISKLLSLSSILKELQADFYSRGVVVIVCWPRTGFGEFNSTSLYMAIKRYQEINIFEKVTYTL